MRNEVRLKRLRMLSDMLKNHDKHFPSVVFNMRSWEEYLPGPGKMKKGHLCKTAACALGSAALWPPFNKMGLKMKFSEDYANKSEPFYRENTHQNAGTAFFGINEQETNYLFMPVKYALNDDAITPHHVAKRVDELIKRYGVGKAV